MEGRLPWKSCIVCTIISIISLTTLIAAQSEENGWGPWTIGDCSRTCGGGVQLSARRCNTGRPGSASCQGAATSYQSCNTEKCPEGSSDFRAYQCSAYNGVNNLVVNDRTPHKYKWSPYYDPSSPCALICQNEYGDTKTLRDTVIDGTACDNGNTFGLCINGVCKPTGCDHKLGSLKVEDKCLLCGGDGQNCETIKGSTIGTKLNSGGKSKVVSFPPGATALRINFTSTSPSSLELDSQNGQSLRLTEAMLVFGKRRMYEFAGTLFMYSMSEDSMRFKARGPINDTLNLMVRFRGLSPLVEYEYSTKLQRDERNPSTERFTWVHGRWTTCSTKCGVGYQLRAVNCIDRQERRATKPDFCSESLMPDRNQTCNKGPCSNSLSVGYRWIKGRWGECSVVCGIGEQTQNMLCIETGATGNSAYVSEDLCKRYVGAMPVYDRACQGDSDECPYWATGSWSECSVTCGYGQKTRRVYCQRDPKRQDADPVLLSNDRCPQDEKPERLQSCSKGICKDGSNNRRVPQPITKPKKEKQKGCRFSRFGCCPDNVTFAKGENHQGCAVRIEHVKDVCELPKERGGCSNYTVKWYFDSKKRQCLRFWYGGCDGTENRFDERASCMSKCLKKVPKIEGCATSRFGCCGDNATFARGENKAGCPETRVVGGCAGTRHGCCEDGVTSARGPDKRGCPEKRLVGGCAGTRHGCCEDGVTSARGPDKRGCPEKRLVGGCAGTRHGCCEDGVTSARGPDKQGCPEKRLVGGCAGTRHGCCADGVTSARGPDKRGCPEKRLVGGCAGTRHGCCEDGVTSARGPDKQGCPEKRLVGGCAGTRHGCCEDGVTSARGPDKRGCPEKRLVGGCAGTRHGCCEDGVTSARGPDKRGCPEKRLVGGCAGTRHGCCEDGVTSARGPDKQGCPEKRLVGGCAGAQYGCCRDGTTVARGENKEGCPERQLLGGCRGTRYGCCRDRKTAARGENYLGCAENPLVRCQDTRYGCCDDRRIAATGPNKEGCPEKKVEPPNCNTSQYGCCPDGTTFAKGPGQEGCPMFDQASCGYDKDPGGCANYSRQWFFNSEYGMCREFWYGGCKGNANRFKSKDECQQKCVEVEGSGRCRLPKVVGPCRATKRRFHFDAKAGRCKSFDYGGCKANANNFFTLGECQAACNGKVSTQAAAPACEKAPCQNGFKCEDLASGSYSCSCNPDWGKDCEKPPPYWCFTDSDCGQGLKCVREKLCDGANCNVYARCTATSRSYTCDRPKCPSTQDCVNDNSLKDGYFCTDKVKNPRPSRVVLDCTLSQHGCCDDGRTPAAGPNKERCPRSCQNSVFGCCPDGKSGATGPEYEGCELEGSGDMPCERTEFGCCDDGVTAATGVGKQGCEETTDTERPVVPEPKKPTVGVEKCTAPLPRLLCTNYTVKWRYDSEKKRCVRHWWGGCKDNGNVFETENECDNECRRTPVVVATPEPVDPDFFNICDMQQDRGPCRAAMPRFYYDPRDRLCKNFIYGGCSGNENNFRTKDECMEECMKGVIPATTPAPTQQTLPTPSRPTIELTGPSQLDEGNQLRLVCRYVGSEQVRLDWFKNGNVLSQDTMNDIRTTPQRTASGKIEVRSEMTIRSAKKSDEGVYVCRASTREIRSLRVTIIRNRRRPATPAPTLAPTPAPTTVPTTEKPTRTDDSIKLSGPTYVEEGNPFRLSCRIVGSDNVEFDWFKDGNVLSTPQRTARGRNEVTSEITIGSAQMSHAGTYVCRASSNLIASHVVQIIKRRRPATTQAPRTEPPVDTDTSITISGNVTVMQGETISITCRAVGPRKPTSIEWFINRRLVNPRAGTASVTDRMDRNARNALISTLSLSNARESNEGVYYCRSRPYGDLEKITIRVVSRRVPEPTTTTTTEAPATAAPRPAGRNEVCLMQEETGRCRASIQRWRYNSLEGRCTQFIYGGCEGNSNNFESEDDCNNYCRARDICYQTKVVGRCRAAFPRFYFDSNDGACKRFIYGGCGGNANNFDSAEGCERKCAEYLRKGPDGGDNNEDVCEQQPEKGSCRDYNIKWYYSKARNRCARFIYTGCDGNGNRFDDEEDCKNECVKTDVVRPTRRPRPRPTPRPTTPRPRPTYRPRPRPTQPPTTAAPKTGNIPAHCSESNDAGSCYDYKIKWYYDTKSRRCLRFYYGGCDGNENRFDSRQKCEMVCVRGIVPVTPRPTRPVPCKYTRYQCCNDGITAAVDAQRSNCRDNVIPQPNGRDYKKVMVGLGEDTLLSCSIQNDQVLWYREGFLLTSSDRFEVFSNGSLLLRGLTQDMAGFYACRFSKGNNIPQLERFKVETSVPLTIVPGPSMLHLKPGEVGFFHCQANGSPKPRVYWKRDGRFLRTTTRHRVFDNGTLIISNTQPTDEGSYQCTAENGVSTPATRTVVLSIKETIEAKIERHSGTFMEGDTFKLKCEASGYPQPDVQWEKEGRTIKDNNHRTVRNGELTVRSASIDDAGVYKCVVTNNKGSASDLTTVQIKLHSPKTKCEDTMPRSKCLLIVRGRLCGFRMFATKCCQSCRREGFL